MRKGMQLAINMLVVIILGLVIVSGGIFMMAQLTSKSTEYISQVDQLTKSKMDKMLSEGKKLAIPATSKKIQKGEDASFIFFGLQNKFDDLTTFKLSTSFESVYHPNTGDLLVPQPLASDANEWFKLLLLESSNEITLETNEARKDLSLVVDFPNDAPAGTYAYKIEVQYDTDKFYDAQIITITAK